MQPVSAAEEAEEAAARAAMVEITQGLEEAMRRALPMGHNQFATVRTDGKHAGRVQVQVMPGGGVRGQVVVLMTEPDDPVKWRQASAVHEGKDIFGNDLGGRGIGWAAYAEMIPLMRELGTVTALGEGPPDAEVHFRVSQLLVEAVERAYEEGQSAEEAQAMLDHYEQRYTGDVGAWEGRAEDAPATSRQHTRDEPNTTRERTTRTTRTDRAEAHTS